MASLKLLFPTAHEVDDSALQQILSLVFTRLECKVFGALHAGAVVGSVPEALTRVN